MCFCVCFCLILFLVCAKKWVAKSLFVIKTVKPAYREEKIVVPVT